MAESPEQLLCVFEGFWIYGSIIQSYSNLIINVMAILLSVPCPIAVGWYCFDISISVSGSGSIVSLLFPAHPFPRSCSILYPLSTILYPSSSPTIIGASYMCIVAAV